MTRQEEFGFREGNLFVKTLRSEEEMRKAYRLRHKVFVDTLKWVSASPDDLEVDSYDAWATSVGLFMEDDRLVGMFRLLPAPGPYMLEAEFQSCLSPTYQLRKDKDTVEITRLTVDPTLQDKGLSSRLMLVLFKAVYQWSLSQNVRYLYMVVEKRFLRALRVIGFPCEPISPAKALPPAGVLSVAAILDWQRFRAERAIHRPEFLEWISAVDGVSVVAEQGALRGRGQEAEGVGQPVKAGACVAPDAGASKQLVHA